MTMRRHILPAIFVLLAPAAFFATPALAASTSFSMKPAKVEASLEDAFEVEIALTAESGPINAVSGAVTFPDGLLELKDIKDGNSIVSFWIERPHLKDGQVRFAGIIPGGYLGSGGRVFSVEFLAKQAGSGSLGMQEVRALLNDGKGTDAGAEAAGAQVAITEPSSSTPAIVPERPDRDPPEAFVPLVTRDPLAFDGKYFLVFSTQDKGSGIDRYEVCERGASDCVPAASPYVLKDQAHVQDVIVKAFDRSGNERDAAPAKEPTGTWWKDMLLVAGLFLIGIPLFIFGRRRKRA